MDYILETIIVGPMEVNCYILGCRTTSEAVIIDPGADYDKIKGCIRELGMIPRYVLNTHGHADHIGANGRFGLPVLINEKDLPFLDDPVMNLSAVFGLQVVSPPAGGLLRDGEEIKIGMLTLTVIHTPGHTPGSTSIRCEDVVFTGDTLFREGIGRTDFPYASQRILLESVRKKLLTLPETMKVYPGHGKASTIGYEKKHNPFL